VAGPEPERELIVKISPFALPVAARYEVDAGDGFLRATPKDVANPPLWFATTAEPSASLADVEACAGGADGFWTGFFQGVDPQFTFASAQHGPLEGRPGCFSVGPAASGAKAGPAMVTFRFEVDAHTVTAACMFSDPQQQDVCRELLGATRVAP